MTKRHRNAGLHAAAGLAAAAVVYGALLSGCVGIAPPRIVGPMRAPIPWQAVRLYTTQQPPQHYQVIAHLDASGFGQNSSQEESIYVLNRLRRQAAGLGANALLLERLGPQLDVTPAWRILAIYVPPPAGARD